MKNRYSVFIRPFLEDDVKFINSLRNNPEVQRLVCNRFRYVSIEIERNWIKDKMTHNQTEEYFAICLNDESEQIIGYQCLRNIDLYNRSAHAAGIVISPDFQDGLYMIDAFLLLLDYAFNEIGINRLTGSCLRQHKNSRIMMEMLGFSLEGIERSSLYKNHRYMDICNYSILYDEYIDFVNNNGYSIKNISLRAKNIRMNLNEV